MGLNAMAHGYMKAEHDQATCLECGIHSARLECLLESMPTSVAVAMPSVCPR